MWHKPVWGLLLSLMVGCAASADDQDDASSSDEAITNAKPRILVVMSSASSVELARGGTTPAGVYLAEVAVPVAKMLEAGAEITAVSPGGMSPTLDDVSDKAKWFDDEAEYQRAKALFAEPRFQHPKRLEDVSDADVRTYDAVFLPGGHAPMNDLHESRDLARVLRAQHARGKLTGAICHGTSGLLSPTTDGQPWIYAGYKLTGYSAVEENLGVVFHYVGGMPKLHLQAELQGSGARYSQSLIPFTSHVVRDRELLTGQDPQSTKAFAKAFVDALAEQRGNSH
ncbi:MAG: thiamine biosynthesis protein ThiJ [Labilithrix sp.]|nr:thiamine biosynthesis protein ThiJ [Labilithrix sp.]